MMLIKDMNGNQILFPEKYLWFIQCEVEQRPLVNIFDIVGWLFFDKMLSVVVGILWWDCKNGISELCRKTIIWL